MLALATRMDDGKMRGEDDRDVPEMTVGQLKTHVDAAFKQVDERFEQVDRRFEQVDRRFDWVDQRFDELRAQMSALYESLRDDIHTVADGVAANATSLAELTRVLTADRARYDGRLDNHEARITSLERRKRRRRA
jgi:chromosome segregation ATPase